MIQKQKYSTYNIILHSQHGFDFVVKKYVRVGVDNKSKHSGTAVVSKFGTSMTLDKISHK